MQFKIIFLFFSTILIISALAVITLQNTIYSVVCLVLSFVASAGLTLLLECEFFAFLFIIVYVGAIAVLFLFVVMMLDIKDLPTNKSNNLKYFMFGIFASLSFLVLIVPSITNYYDVGSSYTLDVYMNELVNYWSKEDAVIEIKALGQLLYTRYVLQFLIAGLILFLALLGVIVLTLNMTVKNMATSVRQNSRNMGL